ncbi:MAG TPA: hypothetical protein VG166_10750 [Caulobacteraceae bacterium]|jgi:hypothetical protein|nr:hypothetical protein [Caulobacteraceae bacterium]
MGKAFDTIMRFFSGLWGLLMMIMGGIWTLQGLNLAFNGPMMGGHPSFMVGDSHWTAYGVILVLLGLGQLIWTVRRRPGA